ncbi:3-oxoacyl-ACP reductase [Planctomycetales bacterium]|nr:3-oxoacyl-ACP reductase [Planctomycetales bacterium]
MTNVFITGATGGIGSATAKKFAEPGTTVFLHTFQNVHAAEKLAEELRRAGAETKIIVADFSKENVAEDLHRQVSERGNTDVLVNAAGTDLMSSSVKKLPFDEKLQLLWQTDVRVPVQLARLFAQEKKPPQTIIFFSWNGADYGWHGESAQLYGTVKGALQGFCRSFAGDTAPNSRVCCLSLGWIKTRWGNAATDSTARKRQLDIYAADSRLNRWGTPEEIAEAVKLLADGKLSFLDGCRLFFDGGKNAGRFLC